METYSYEKIIHENQIPALIAVLDGSSVVNREQITTFIPAHWHRSVEIALIENAESILKVGMKETLIKDDFTCINSGEVHSVRAQSITDQSHCIILVLSYEFIKSYCPDIDEIYFDLSLKPDHDDLKKLYYHLEELFLNQSKYTYLEINACLIEILHLLLTEYQGQRIGSESLKKNQELMREILTYIHENYQEDLKLSIIADNFHICHEYFSRQFHHYIGETFRDYVSSYRLYRAYGDIVNTNQTIYAIATKHGFANVKSLIRVFKNTYQETPLQYRLQRQLNSIEK
ncbi:MAG: helix-turn-helix transcriptional regulator [Erysipelotrichaceae bacterium]